MESYEVLRAAFDIKGCKNVAAEMHLSLSLIHQWSRGNGGKSAAANPLGRVDQVLAITADRQVLEWLCARRNGFFVENPPVKPGRLNFPAARLTALRELIQMESALLETERQPASPTEVRKVRRLWETLKSNGERVVRLLEDGGTKCKN